VAAPLYLDTSAILRAIVEAGSSPDVETRLRDAPVLVTSRLSQVEASRAFHRLRQVGAAPEPKLADAEREIAALWARCELWELTAAVCEMARNVAPAKALRALDALHLATFVLARREIVGLVLLTVDERLQEAAGVA
jgi:predicted nucleic acid-binding protein